ncbi:hypothetical protein, partial [Burkholderia sp. Bp8986]|uniref:hypothetical protein n=1 Tax=Burkholderia sp. Bp8986 TaxID=2184550 RepID=UPI000FB66FE3
MEQKHYKGSGLFGLRHGGETQPFVFPAEEEGKTLGDARTMKLSNGQLIWFDPRAYDGREELLAWGITDDAALNGAASQEGVARELGEKLFGGKWTDKQVKMYAAMLDEMSFFIKQFKYAL